MSEEEELTGGQAARLLRVTRQHINRLAHEGKIPARRVANRYWVFRRADVEAYGAQPKDKGGRPPKEGYPQRYEELGGTENSG